MEQLILHGIGDYLLQRDEDALNKKKKGKQGLIACLNHCTTYSLPFFFIGTWKAVLVIFITHFIIDRTRIIEYTLALKNNVRKKIIAEDGRILSYDYDISNFGFSKEKPFAMSVWLFIITDNVCHLICNYLALKYL